MSGRKRKVALIGALTSLVVIAAASFASAAVVTKKYHGGKVVVACYKTDTGAMRVVSNKNRCKANETVLRWYRSGSAGPAGKAGAAGKPGVAGASLLSGAVAPTATDGKNGDFWFDSVAGTLYGPKAAGAWPVGTTLKGLQGETGLIGPMGPMGMPGIGLPGLPGTPGTPGTPGANGAAGADGADGNTILSGNVAPTGTDGADGDYFLDTATSTLYGPKAGGSWTGTDVVLKGADGTDGTDGNDGGAGPQGIQGVQGIPGPQGSQGPAGDDGADGVGTIFAASTNATPGTMTTVAGGLVGTATTLPLSGAYSEDGVSIPGGNIDTTMSSVPQVFPRNGTVTAISGRAVNSVALSLIGTTMTMRVQLYTDPSGGTNLTAVPGASCDMAPSLTGIVTIGTLSNCVTTGLSIPVTAGTSAMVVVTATATGLSLINTVAARLSTSVAVS